MLTARVLLPDAPLHPLSATISPPAVLVTGASRGLGRGIALQLAGGGYSVAINYASSQEAAEETAALCRERQQHDSQRFVPVQADISSTEQRNALVENALSELGRLDGLVNNAGISPPERADITEASEASFEKVMQVNLQGPYFLTQRVVQYWLNDEPDAALPGGFKIIYVTSISSHTASVNRGEYCISKAGLSMAVQLWASRLAGEGIQVYEVRPGIMLTDMTRGVKEKYDKLIAEGVVPQKRWGTPDDVGQAVRAFVDGDFSYSTGTVVDVDGGFQMRQL